MLPRIETFVLAQGVYTVRISEFKQEGHFARGFTVLPRIETFVQDIFQ